MRTRRQEVGWIEVICGSMFSGKTEELIRRIRRAMLGRLRVQVFKPAIDCRYDATAITSHSRMSLEAEVVSTAEEIARRVRPDTQVVGIDEGQFFSGALVDVVQDLADRGVRVLVAGLDQDYRGRPFEPMPQLLAIAEEITKCLAVCACCGEPANRSQRLIARDDDRILVGAAESYEARCRRCFEEPPTALLAEAAHG
jgi:thymidine kinase